MAFTPVLNYSAADVGVVRQFLVSSPGLENCLVCVGSLGSPSSSFSGNDMHIWFECMCVFVCSVTACDDFCTQNSDFKLRTFFFIFTVALILFHIHLAQPASPFSPGLSSWLLPIAPWSGCPVPISPVSFLPFPKFLIKCNKHKINILLFPACLLCLIFFFCLNRT